MVKRIKYKKKKEQVVAPKIETLASIGSYSTLKTVEEITKEFVAVQEKDGNGKNTHLKDFLHIAKLVGEHYESKSFGFQDFITLAVAFDTPTEELKKFFTAWIRHMEKSKRIKTIQGCYSYPVHFFV